MKTNVTLRGNVYINKTQRRSDPDFVGQIRDYAVLKTYYNPSTGFCDAPLSKLQRKIVELGLPKCTYESGTMSWGVPVGGDRLVCRCEEKGCKHYPECSARADFEYIERNADQPGSLELEIPVLLPCTEISQPKEKSTTEEVAELVDRVSQITEIIESSTEASTTEPTINLEEIVSVMDDAVPTNSESQNRPETDEGLTQDAIISADLDSRIWVNAGPGTGKTYTVINRLCKVFEGDGPVGTVLVLCFSKNAVNVIGSRLRDKIGSYADALMEDERLVIRTFDSFATYLLADELPDGLDYDQRIELFIEKLQENPDVLEGVSYLIVDEVQDTVSTRARMLRAMIESAKFGILLLGDRCQAIYDWNARDRGDWTSDELFQWIITQGFQTCEMETNYRQSGVLAQLGENMRRSLLHDTEDIQEQVLHKCKDELQRLWPSCKAKELPQKLTGQSDLILCKTNGEAAVISDQLFDGGTNFVGHTVMQAAGYKSLAPWIGMILGGCMEEMLSRDAFTVLAERQKVDGIDEKWNALKSLDPHAHSAVLHRIDVLKRLAQMDALPELCLNLPGDGVIVSTVHRAKGSEAEHVYWLSSPLVFDKQSKTGNTKGDALKASYVAITRAKKKLQMVENEQNYLRMIGENRWIKQGLGKKKGRPYCAGITMRPEDVDLISCASGLDAQQMQERISHLEPGFDLQLYPSSGGACFDIFFDDFLIGKTSDKFMDALFAGFQATNKNTNVPANLDSVYVSSLITVVQPGMASEKNVYQASGCWLSFELGGFAHINYI